MKIVDHKEDTPGTIIYLENADGTRHAVCIPTGNPEQWHGAWDLPDDIDPVDLVLVLNRQADGIDELSPFEGDYAANRERVLATVRANRKKFEWPKATEAKIRSSCQLPPGLREDFRNHTKKQAEDIRKQGPEASPAQVIAESIRKSEILAEGNKRRQEEIIADDIVSSMPAHLRRQPRTPESAKRADVPVGLAIQFVP